MPIASHHKEASVHVRSDRIRYLSLISRKKSNHYSTMLLCSVHYPLRAVSLYQFILTTD